MSDLALQLQNYRLTTAQIFYFRTDYPGLLQEFIWQHLDLAPRFPELQKFLTFWERNLTGRLHSVRVCHAELVRPAELRASAGTFHIH